MLHPADFLFHFQQIVFDAHQFVKYRIFAVQNRILLQITDGPAFGNADNAFIG